jgi:PRTRC genetic system protein B
MNAAPLAQLTFYNETILLTKFNKRGKTTYPVNPTDIAGAFTNIPMSTGLLPPNTLCYAQIDGKTALAVLIPAGKHIVQVETATGNVALRVPLPPLVFAGRGRQYFVFALKSAVPTLTAPLYYAPCSNVHPHGLICQGNTPFPEATSTTIYSAFRTFLYDSTFNTDLSTGRVTDNTNPNVLTLWHDLHTHKTRRFPLRALRPVSLTLDGLIHQLSHTSIR